MAAFISPEVRPTVRDGVWSVTCKAPTNIACIKYWGKRDPNLNLPINSSVSITLDMADLCTVTTVATSKNFEKTRLWLNGTEENPETNKRVLAVLREIRSRSQGIKDDSNKILVPPGEGVNSWHVHIVSYNTFPTAAGLASSASGYACMVRALAALFCVEETYVGELSTIARQGSGSACRSLYGGFVRWEMGQKADGSDSMAVQIAQREVWPEMEAVIVVVSDHKKDVSSTGGMTTSVNTSQLLDFRAKKVVAPRLAKIEEAYKNRDFVTFGQLTMQDSNQFHATCLDTYPPIFYMNDVSRDVINFVHRYNSAMGKITAAYTFDAGPNAVIWVEKENTQFLLSCLRLAFSPKGNSLPVSSISFDSSLLIPSPRTEEEAAFVNFANDVVGAKYERLESTAVKQLLHTRVGKGSHAVDSSNSLVFESTGFPKPDYHKF
jgi:diphosphomevalonate decarboxylase